MSSNKKTDFAAINHHMTDYKSLSRFEGAAKKMNNSNVTLKKIAVCGTQGQGKSTFIKDFISKFPMYSTPEETYRDFVKKENLSLNKGATKEVQEKILNFMIDQTMYNYGNKKMIFDRCPIDNLMYSMWSAEKGKTDIGDEFVEKSISLVRESLKFLDLIIFIPMTKHHTIPLIDDGVRDVDPIYVKEIDTLFKCYFSTYKKRVGNFFDFDDCPAIVEVYGDRNTRLKMAQFYINENGDAYGEENQILGAESLEDVISNLK
jgi:nicotinamide riboside kinase